MNVDDKTYVCENWNIMVIKYNYIIKILNRIFKDNNEIIKSARA